MIPGRTVARRSCAALGVVARCLPGLTRVRRATRTRAPTASASCRAGTIEKRARAAAEAADDGTAVRHRRQQGPHLHARHAAARRRRHRRGHLQGQHLRAAAGRRGALPQGRRGLLDRHGGRQGEQAAADKLNEQVREGARRATPRTSSSAASPTRTCCSTACSCCTARSPWATTARSTASAPSPLTGGRGDGGTLDVSLEGKPYPLRYERAGGAGTLTLATGARTSRWRAPDEDDVVDYGKQRSTP